MALPGSAPVAGEQPEDDGAACGEAGERIVEMVWEDLNPRDIMTPPAFGNAVNDDTGV